MAESMKSTHDFIKTAYAIRVGVLSSQDAEIVSKRNNLSFTELIQPFCTLTNEAKIQGINAQSYRAYNINVRVSDIRQKAESVENRTIRQQISDLVSKSGAIENMQKLNISCDQYDLVVNRSCPWMDIYRDLMIRLGPPQIHEFLNHHIACMLVVSSLHPNPMQEFSNLSQLQNHIQHGDSNDSCKWMTPNTLKFFVFLHDVQQSDEAKAKEVFSSLQATYGTKVCHFLRVNSRDVVTSDETGLDLPDPWHQFMTFSVNPLSDADTSSSEPPSTNGEQNQSWLNDLQTRSGNDLGKGFGCCLTMADHDGLQTFMQDFIVNALLPHMEKTIKNINDQLSARKALHKSLFRATRTFFGSNKSNVNANSGYNHDANELLLRKLADLCFLSQMYDQAFYFYHNARKDYMNDQAWIYAAGASEMAATSNFMQHNAQKTYPAHYMESAITTYTDVCKMDYLALRCTLIHAECLQLLGMFSETAFYLIKITNETDDLRSALLLEQAAHCYLKMKEPQPKKFAFHLILAGHRFSKCGQRNHALRSYNLSLQVYQGQGWSLAEDHINFALARQSFNLKKLLDASNSFRSLLLERSSQPISQQAAFFHEFIHIFQQCQNQNDSAIKYAMLGLPKLLDNETKVLLEQNNYNMTLDSKMLELEDTLLHFEKISSESLVGGVKCFSKYTSNTQNPVTAVKEEIMIRIVLQNYLDISLCLSDVSMQWQYESRDNEVKIDEIGDDAFHCTTVPFILIAPLVTKTVDFTLTPLKAGKITARGIVYNLGLPSTEGPVNDTPSDISYSVKDYQSFNIVGKRLNKSKEEKLGILHDIDLRLSLHVQSILPKLSANFSHFPTSMVCNEVLDTTLILKNTGNVQLDVVKVLSSDIVQLTINSNSEKCLLPNVKFDHGQKQAKKISLTNLLSEPLLPGKVLELNVHIKAPSFSGLHRADTLFFCKTNSISSGPTSRTFFVRNCVDCKECVVINGELTTPIDQASSIISLQVKNTSGLKDWRLYVDNVTCLNSYFNVMILGDGNLPSLVMNNILSMYLRVTKLALDVDFPQIIVHWKGGYGSGEREVHGEQHIDVGEILHSYSMFSSPERTAFPKKIAANDNIVMEEYSLQSLHRLLTWRLHYEVMKEHNFSAHGSCHVDLTLMLFNLSNLRLQVTVSLPHLEDNFSPHQSQTDFAWIGRTEAKRLVEPHKKIELALKACFSRHGVFNISGVSVTAIPEHMRDETLQIPQKPPCGYFITII